jgi:hypothetical protein
MWNPEWKEVLPIGYHFWRTIEIVSIIGMIKYYRSFLILLGAGMFGLTMIYERALQYVDHGVLFYPQAPWKILRWEIPFTNRFMIITGVIGLIILIIALRRSYADKEGIKERK